MKKTVYEPGEWVLTGAKENRGFVISSNQYSTEVVVTSYKNNDPIAPTFYVEKGEVKLSASSFQTYALQTAPELPRVFSYDELDQALLTKDKEWYKEIMELKEVEMSE